MNLRQWGDAIASLLIEWEHTPPTFSDDRDTAWHTKLTHVCGAQFSIGANRSAAISNNPDVEKDISDSTRLTFSPDWPKHPLYGTNNPNTYRDDTHYRATASASSTPQSNVNGLRGRFIKPLLSKWYKLEKEMLATVQEWKDNLAEINELCARLGLDPYPDDQFRGNYQDQVTIGLFTFSRSGHCNLVRHGSSIDPEMAKDLLMIYYGKAKVVPIEGDPEPEPDDLPLFAALES